MTSEISKKKMVSRDTDEEEEEEEEKVAVSFRGLNTGPKKKLLVIHLNGLVAHTFFDFERVKVPKDRRPDGIFGRKLVFKRPFCDEFLKFCFERFEVGIWSSAKERNVDGVNRHICGAFTDKLLFTWDQSRCTTTGLKTLQNKDKPIFLKELMKLWDNEDSSLPWPRGRYSKSNTLLIDGSPCRAILNPPNTAIFPHPYKVEQINDDFLGPDGEMREYLEGLAAAADVQSHVKDHPFGQDPITPNRPDWAYYSKIVDEFSATSTKASFD